jgi:hypothetical protein
VVFSVFQTGWSATAWARVIVKDYLRPAAVRVGVPSSEMRDVDGKKLMVITTKGHSPAAFLVSAIIQTFHNDIFTAALIPYDGRVPGCD